MCLFLRLFVRLFPYFSEALPPPSQLVKAIAKSSSVESIFHTHKMNV